MKIITKYAFLLSVVMLAACTSDDDATNNENAVVTAPVVEEMAFSGSIETDNVTRTAFSDYTVDGKNYLKTVWKLADAIRVYNMAESTNNNGTFVIKDGGIDATDGKQAVFTGEKIASNGAETDKFYAVYPDMEGSSFSKDGNAVKLNATLPAVQTAITNNINPDLQFMTGYTTKRNFDFKNVVSFIKVTITNSTSTGNFKIHAIRFTSNSSENKIAGSFTATVTDGGDPTISNVGDGAASSVVVENDDQSPLADGEYYIAVLPTKLTSGFTLQLEDLTSGKEQIYQRKSTASYTIERSKVIDLGSYNAESLENGTIYDGGIIDLGLPDGTLWATRNISNNHDTTSDGFADVGKPGGYYSWGEVLAYGEEPATKLYLNVPQVNYTGGYYTNDRDNVIVDKEGGFLGAGRETHNANYQSKDAKTRYSWKTYKYGYLYHKGNIGFWSTYGLEYTLGNDSQSLLGWLWTSNYGCFFDRYNTDSYLIPLNNSNNGVGTKKSSADNQETLYDVDDAAYQKTGGKFRMPTLQEAQALVTCINNIDGNYYSTVPGYTSRFIKLPKGGSYYYKNGTDLYDTENVQIWTNTVVKQQGKDSELCAYSIEITQATKEVSGIHERYAGKNIRPVLVIGDKRPVKEPTSQP